MANSGVPFFETRETDQFLNGLSILVVDCDSTSLTIVSAMLRAYGHDVVTVNQAINALRILRERAEDLDLILTEVNLPDMDKFKLLEMMGETSCLPIVVFSGDDSESTMLGSLFKGAVQYILKPMTRSDVKILWQFSYMKKRRKMASIEHTNKFLGESLEDEALKCQSVLDTPKKHTQKGKTNELEEIDRLEEESKHNLTVQKKPKLTWTSGIQQGKIKRSDKDEDESKNNVSVLKKPKLIWTTELHDIFLRAIETLGIDDAHPKQILQHMNVPGLRKENIASHLQKYRLSLKRKQDAIQKNSVGDYDHLLATSLHRQHYQLPFIMKACPPDFESHFQTDANASLCPSLGSTQVAYNEGSDHNNNAATFQYGQLAPESNQLYSTYIAFSPVESTISGKLKNLGQMRNHNAEDFLQHRTDCPDVGNFGSKCASNCPTTVDNSLNHKMQHWQDRFLPQQHRFLLQQTSEQLPPPAHQVQWGHNWCETERGEICELFDMAETAPRRVPGQKP